MAGDPVFPPEIWLQIIPYTRNSPAPLSSPAREELHQPRLCALARTCKLFKEVCTPLLYTHIYTDHFDSLLSHAGRKDMAGNRFAITQSLSIEYCEKPSEATYQWLMGGRVGFRGYGTTVLNHRHDLLLCALEVMNISKQLKAATAIGMAEMFPALDAIAVSSIYGSQNHLWDKYDHLFEVDGRRSDTQECADLFAAFIPSGNLRSLCHRAPGGPLSISSPPSPQIRQRIPQYPSVTLHSYHEEIHRSPLPLHYPAPVRWIIDTPSEVDWANSLRSMGSALLWTLHHRKQADPSHRSTAILEVYHSTKLFGRARFDPKFDLVGCSDLVLTPSILSPPRILSPDVQRMMAAKLGSELQELFRQNCNPEDTVSWRISEDQPVCQACLCGPPQ